MINLFISIINTFGIQIFSLISLRCILFDTKIKTIHLLRICYDGNEWMKWVHLVTRSRLWLSGNDGMFSHCVDYRETWQSLDLTKLSYTSLCFRSRWLLSLFFLAGLINIIIFIFRFEPFGSYPKWIGFTISQISSSRSMHEKLKEVV